MSKTIYSSSHTATVTFAEDVYIAPNATVVINGDMWIYTNNLIVDPSATITGPGTLHIGPLSHASTCADAPTYVDGNGAKLDVIVSHENPFNIILADLAFAATPTNNQATFYLGKSFAFANNHTTAPTTAITGNDVLLNGFNVVFDNDATQTGYDQSSFFVTNGTGIVRKEALASTWDYAVGLAEGDYTPARATQTGTADNLDVRVLAGGINPRGINRVWYVAEGTPGGSNVTLSLEHNGAGSAGGPSTENPQFTASQAFVTRATSASGTWDQATCGTDVTPGTITSGPTITGSHEHSRTFDDFTTYQYYTKQACCQPPTFTVSATNPTSCTGTGSLTLTSLTPSTSYTVSYSANGTPVAPATLLSDASGQIVLNNLAAGNYTAIVVSLNGCTSTAQTSSLTAASAPSAPSVSLVGSQTLCLGQSVTLSATGAAGATINWTGPGLSQTTGSTVTATPTSAGAAVYSATQTLAGCISPTASVTATVSSCTTTVGQPPVITGNSIVTGINTSATICLPASDPDGTTSFTAAICGQPTNGTASVPTSFTGNQLCVTYTPPAGFTGNAGSICVVITDPTGLTATAQVPVSVTATPTSGTTCDSQNGTITVLASGGSLNGATLRYVVTNASGSILYTSANPSFAGVPQGSYRVYAVGYTTASAPYAVGQNISVVTANDACAKVSSPIVYNVCPPTSSTTCDSQNGTITVLASGANMSGATLRYVATNASGVIVYTSTTPSFSGVAASSYNVYAVGYTTASAPYAVGQNISVVTANDACAQVSAPIVYTVCPTPAQPPVITGQPLVTGVNTPGQVCLPASDPDGTTSFTAAICGQPTSGTASVPTSFTGNQLCVTYTPPAGFTGNAGSICVLITDPTGLTATAQVPVSVTATPTSSTTCDSQNGTITVLASGGSLNGATLRYVVTNASGSILYTSANPSFAGVPQGSYRVYAVGYTTATAPYAVGQNISVVTANDVCAKVSPPIVYNVCPPTSSTTCDSQNGTITVLASGGNMSGATLRYVATNASGVIVYTSTTPSFSGVASGTYNVYAVGYTTASAPYAVGQNISVIPTNDVCAQVSAPITYNVCPPTSSTTCDSQNGTITVLASGGSLNGATLRYVVTNTSGSILYSSANPSFVGVPQGTYNVYAVGYTTASAPYSVGQNISVVTTNDACAQVSAPVAYNVCPPTSSTTCDSQNGTITVLASGGNMSGATLRYVATNASGVIVYTSTTPSFSGVVAGTYNVYAVGYTTTSAPYAVGQNISVVTTNDVCAQVSAPIVYTVCPTPAQPPVITGQPLVTGINTPGQVCLPVSDPDGTTSFTAAICGQPTSGTASVPTSFTGNQLCVTYTPPAGFTGNAGSICVIITDPTGLTATAQVPVSVTATPTSSTTCDSQNGTITVLASGGSLNGATLRYVVTNASGSILYTSANPSFAGVPQGSYRVYAVGYTTASPPYAVGQNISVVTTNDACAKVSAPIVYNVCPPTSSTTCDSQNGTITIASTGGNMSGATLRYVATNASGVIVYTSTTPSFSGVAAGSYNVYAVGYTTASAPYSVGQNISVIPTNDACAQVSAPVTYNVCPPTSSTTCDSQNGTITVLASGGSLNGATLRYVVTNGSGSILYTSANPSFVGVPQGTYNVYAVGYTTATAPYAVGQNISVVTTNDACAKVSPPIVYNVCAPTSATTCDSQNGTITVLASGGNVSGVTLRYVATNATGVIVYTSSTPSFSGVAAGTYNVYAVGYTTANAPYAVGQNISVVTANDACAQVSAPIVYTVCQTPAQPPVITGQPLVTGINTPATVCLPVSDPDGTTSFTAAICGQPTSGTASVPTSFTGNQLCVVYTPPAGFTGNAGSICVIITDPTGLTATAQVPVSVTATPPAAQPPVITGQPLVVAQNTPGQVCLPVSDPDGTTSFTATICAQPTNGTASVPTSFTGNQLCVTYTPPAGFTGNAGSICVIITDPTGLTATAQVPVSVTATPTSVTTCDSQNGTITVLASGGNLNGATLRYVATNASGVILYTSATPSFSGVTAGTYNVYAVGYTTASAPYAVGQNISVIPANDACAQVSAPIVYTVCPTPAQPPVITGQPLVTGINTPGQVCLPVSDPDGTTSFTASICGQPTTGTASVPASFTGNQLCVTYTPPTGFTGNAGSICVIITDPTGLTATAQVPVSVTATPTPAQPPVITGQPLVVSQNTSGTVCLPVSDPDGTTSFTAAICGQPTSGTASVPTSFTGNQLCVVYTPPAGFTGNAGSICVLITDPTGLTATAQVPVSVTATPTSSTTCDSQNGTITVVASGANMGSATLRYIATNASGVIVYTSSTPSFSGVVAGTYNIYAVGYTTASAPYSVGQNISVIPANDACAQVSAPLVYNVCTPTPPTCTAPLLTVSNATCTGNNSYSVAITSSGSVTASAGTVSANAITGIPVGTNVVVTASLPGCAFTSTLTVVSPVNCNPVSCTTVPTLTVGQPICNTATGGYAVSFASTGTVSTSSGILGANSISVASATNITIVATNPAGCSVSVAVAAPASCSTACSTPQLSVGGAICNGDGTYNVTFITAPAVSVTASTGTVMGNMVMNIPSGTGVTITATSPCGTQSVAVSAPTACTTTCSPVNRVTTSICNNETINLATYFPAGGSFTLLTGTAGSLSGSTFNGIASGPGLFKVGYLTGNCAPDTATIIVRNCATPLVCNYPINAIGVDATCGASDGRAAVTIGGLPTGATASFAWNNGQVGSAIAGLAAGVYSVTATITDGANICTVVDSVQINNIGGPIAVTRLITPANCSTNGAVSLSIVSGTGPFTVTWSGASSGTQANVALGAVTITNLSPGAYTFQISSAASGNCYGYLSVNIPRSDAARIALTATPTAATACGSASGSIQVNVTPQAGVTGPFSFSLNGQLVYTSALPSYTLNNLTAGIYTVAVGSSAGCTTSATTVVIPETSAPAVAGWTAISPACPTDQGRLVFVGGQAGTTFQVYDATTGTPVSVVSGASATTLVVSAGTYAIETTTAGCTSLTALTITRPQAIDFNVQYRAETCAAGGVGNSDGSLSVVQITGGTAPFTVIVTNSQNQTIAAGNLASLPAGNYSIRVVDANGCAGSEGALVTVPPCGVVCPVLAFNTSVVDAQCGQANGSATAQLLNAPTGAGTAVTYAWSNGQNGASISGLAAGVYSVTAIVTSANGYNGCRYVDAVHVNAIGGPVFTVSPVSPASCTAANGTAVVNILSGTGPFTISWTGPTSGNQTIPNAAPVTLTGLAAGSYVFTLTGSGSASACQGVYNVVLPGTSGNLVATATTTNVTGCGASNGQLAINVSGGVGPFTYTVNGYIQGQTAARNFTVPGLPAGTYAIDVADANGCVSRINRLINTAGQPAIAGITSTNATCPQQNGTIAFNGSGLATDQYTVTIAGTATQIGQTAGNTAASYSVPAGTYLITRATSTSCVSVTTVTITQPTGIAFNVQYGQPTCVSPTSGSLAAVQGIGGTAPLSYTITGASGVVTNASALPAGSYTVTAGDANGCTLSQSVTLTAGAVCNQPPVAVADINNTLVNVPVSGQVLTNDFDPDNNVITPSQVTNPTHGTVVFNPNGTYTYTPTAGYVGRDVFTYRICDSGTPSLCDTTTVTIVIRPVSTTANNQVVANDDAIRTRQNTPVKIVVLANDYDPDGNVLVGPTLGAPTLLTNPTSGTVVYNPADSSYTYTPIPGFTGTVTFAYQVCDNGVPAACDTALVTVDVLPVSTTANQAPIAVDDANGTRKNVPVGGTVARNDSDPDGNPLVFTPVTSPINGTVVVSPTGSYTYTPAPGYVGPDRFTYKVCDNGTPSLCDTATVYITVYDVPCSLSLVASVTGSPVCVNANAGLTVTITGGTAPFTYSWTGPGGFTSTQQNPIIANAQLTNAGSYTVVVTDATGCSRTAVTSNALVVQVCPAPCSEREIGIVAIDPSCGQTNGTATADLVPFPSGGLFQISYQWTNVVTGAVVSTAPTATSLTAGVYNLVVGVTQNGQTCSYSATAALSNVGSASLTVGSPVAAGCGVANGSVPVTIVNGAAPFTVRYNGPVSGSVASATTGLVNLAGLAAGTYSIQLVDANGCITSRTLTVPSQAAQQFNVTTQATPTSACGASDGQIRVSWNAVGAGPYQVTLNGVTTTVTSTSATFTGLAAGTYPISVATSSSCNSGTAIVNVPGSTTFAVTGLTTTSATCAGDNGVLNFAGGQPGTQFTVTYLSGTPVATVSGATSTTLTASPGTYVITATNQTGCTSSTVVTVDGPAAISFNIQRRDVVCGTPGSLSVTNISGGTGTYTVAVFNPATSAIVTNLSSLTAGTYDITVTDQAGCFALQSITIGTSTSACGTCLTAKVYLQGALLNNNNALSTGNEPLMRDDLRAQGYLPATTPYGTAQYPGFVRVSDPITATIAAGLTAVTGDQAIVDWVFLELRNKTNPTQVVQTRSALVLRNGSIVDANGQCVSFDAPADNYYIAVRHRNHLGVMTQETLLTGTGTITVDFRTRTPQQIWDKGSALYADKERYVIPYATSYQALWAGNANRNTLVAYQGPNEDLTEVYNQVITAPNSFNSPSNVLSGYYSGDVDMNGQTVYQGQNDEPTTIFNILVLHPSNVFNSPSFENEEQLP